MRIPAAEVLVGEWIRIPGKPSLTGTGMVLDKGEAKDGRIQLGVLLEYPPPTHDYELLQFYRHDFLEIEPCGNGEGNDTTQG